MSYFWAWSWLRLYGARPKPVQKKLALEKVFVG